LRSLTVANDAIKSPTTGLGISPLLEPLTRFGFKIHRIRGRLRRSSFLAFGG
jgi:hypothetical protein